MLRAVGTAWAKAWLRGVTSSSFLLPSVLLFLGEPLAACGSLPRWFGGAHSRLDPLRPQV